MEPAYIVKPFLRADLNPPVPGSAKDKMLRGELYHAFAPDIIKERQRCTYACNRLNSAGETSRRKQIELWRE
jgi:hypothetical protein